jgi:hypothetical protein
MSATSRGAAFIALVLATISIPSCRGDVTAAEAGDALEQDSTLTLQVMRAQGDSSPFTNVGESIDESERFVDVTVAQSSLKSKPQTDETISRIALIPAGPAQHAAPQPTVSRIRIAPPSRSSTRSSVKTARPVAHEAARPVEVRASATIRPGTRLSLASTQRICVNTSKVGDRFTARVLEPVINTDGTLIPRGARATGVIQSLTGSMGEENLDIDIRSVSVNGSSYPVPSRVTRIQLDRTPGAERCIPDAGVITAELTSPLRISLR